MECAALVRAIRQGDLDRLIIPEAPLDILAQQIVATCASSSAGAPARARTVEHDTAQFSFAGEQAGRLPTTPEAGTQRV